MKRSPWRYIWKSEGIRNRLLLTLGILVIYRLIANIPVPGFNAQVIAALNSSRSAAGDLISILNVLSGGTLSSFSILAMGVYPYITASIILQLLGPIIPSIQDKLKNDPKEGRKWMEKWTMYLSIPLAFLSAIGQIGLFNQILPGVTVLKEYGWSGSNLLPAPCEPGPHDCELLQQLVPFDHFDHHLPGINFRNCLPAAGYTFCEIDDPRTAPRLPRCQVRWFHHSSAPCELGRYDPVDLRAVSDHIPCADRQLLRELRYCVGREFSPMDPDQLQRRHSILCGSVFHPRCCVHLLLYQCDLHEQRLR